jgi:hypothetical protein
MIDPRYTTVVGYNFVIRQGVLTQKSLLDQGVVRVLPGLFDDVKERYLIPTESP